MNEADNASYALIYIGLYGIFAGHKEDAKERASNIMSFVRELDPTRFDAAQPRFEATFSEFVAAA